MDIEHARFNMIEQQIRPWNVLDAQVLQLLEVVKREDFVPLAHKALAFMDMEIPLREGGARGQTMLAPRVEARLLQELQVQRHEKVLEIGTGSGFMAALLAHRAQEVHTLECHPAVARLAEKTDFDPYAGRKLYSHLHRLGFTDIRAEAGAHHLIYGPLKEMDSFNWIKKIEVISRKVSIDIPGYASAREFLDDFRRHFAEPGRFTYTPLISCWGRRPPP